MEQSHSFHLHCQFTVNVNNVSVETFLQSSNAWTCKLALLGCISLKMNFNLKKSAWMNDIFHSQIMSAFFRSRWVWTRAELTQQMTGGGLWNQPLTYDSLTYWSDLVYPVRCCTLPSTKAGYHLCVILVP